MSDRSKEISAKCQRCKIQKPGSEMFQIYWDGKEWVGYCKECSKPHPELVSLPH